MAGREEIVGVRGLELTSNDFSISAILTSFFGLEFHSSSICSSVLQVCKQSYCQADIRMYSQCLFPVVVTSVEQVVVVP